MAKYSYSTDEENYGGGEFDSVQAACDEAAADVGVGQHFWVGEITDPPSPETFWKPEHWLDHVSEQDAYAGDWAEGWDRWTDAQQKELETEVRAVMAAWLSRHDLRPRFFTIVRPQKFYVASKTEAVFEIEAM